MNADREAAKLAAESHLAVRGLFQAQSIPACGKWSKDLTSDPAHVTCDDCRATLDYAMAESAVRAQLGEK